MSQRVSIDLVKNPEVADVIADLQVGDSVDLKTSIVSKDDQTVVLEVEAAEESTPMEEKGEDMMASETETPAEDSAKKV